MQIALRYTYCRKSSKGHGQFYLSMNVEYMGLCALIVHL